MKWSFYWACNSESIQIRVYASLCKSYCWLNNSITYASVLPVDKCPAQVAVFCNWLVWELWLMRWVLCTTGCPYSFPGFCKPCACWRYGVLSYAFSNVVCLISSTVTFISGLYLHSCHKVCLLWYIPILICSQIFVYLVVCVWVRSKCWFCIWGCCNCEFEVLM